MRSVWVRGAIALVLAALAARTWWLGFVYLRDDLALPIAAWPLGLVAAAGAYAVIALVLRAMAPRTTSPGHLSPAQLDRELRRRLSTLGADGHRGHPLGDPFPCAVVTSTGVRLVTAAPLPGSLADEAGVVRHNGGRLNDARYLEVKRLVPTVADVLAQQGLDVTVRALVVVDDATLVAPVLQLTDREVTFAPLDRLPEVVGHGPSDAETAVDAQAVLAALARWRPTELAC